MHFQLELGNEIWILEMLFRQVRSLRVQEAAGPKLLNRLRVPGREKVKAKESRLLERGWAAQRGLQMGSQSVMAITTQM